MARKRRRRTTTADTPMNDPDHISDLPQPILHRILSLLSTKDVTKTSVLSKLFQSTWLSLPIVDLDSTVSHSSSEFSDEIANTMMELAEDFFDSVDRTIEQRRNLETNLQKLRLRIPVCEASEYLDHVNDLISFSITKMVSNLELDLEGFVDEYSLSFIRSPANGPANSVKTLILSNLRLKSSDDLMIFPGLENLCITKCKGFKDFKISSNCIQSIELITCAGLSSVEIGSLSLRRLVFVEEAKKSTNVVNPCTIDLLDCKFLQYLSISISSSNWVDEYVTKLVHLEYLKIMQCTQLTHLGLWNEKLKTIELINCALLKQVKIFRIRLPNLETLKVDSCSQLCNVEIEHDRLHSIELTGSTALRGLHIDTPQLLYFMYKGPVIPFSLFNSRASLDANLSIYPISGTGGAYVYFNALRDFVGHFDHINVLNLACTSSEDLIFPEEFRWERGPTLCDLKHLKVQSGHWERISTKLVDSLIWLSPHLETLAFVSGKHDDISLKFQYERVIGEEEEDEMCCFMKIVKCWRHSLKRVEMKNFDADDADNLKNYFQSNAKLPVTIC